MPPLAKCCKLVMVAVVVAAVALVVRPAGLAAQTSAPGDANLYRAAGPAASYAAASAARNPLPPPRRDAPIPLLPAGRSGRAEAARRPLEQLPSLAPMASGLAIVLGLFLAAAWVFRRAAPKAATLLPGEVVEILGRAPLAGRQQMHLLRCGNKLLLVSVTPAGAETLTEVTDPSEVDRLAGLCRQAHAQSATVAFRQVFQQLGARSEKRDE